MDRNHTNPLDGLYEIVNDLWAHAETNPPSKADEKKEDTASVAESTKENALPSFETLWKTADESIDWTDVLVSPIPTDGFTGQARWDFLRSQVESVLSGDTRAYTKVLQEVRPLDDLKGYAHKIRVTCPHADRAVVSFEAMMEDAAQAEEAYETYLCGIGIRCARDMFAVLPVSEVEISGRDSRGERLHVVFTRASLRGVRFGFIVPTTFVITHGGTIVSPEDA